MTPASVRDKAEILAFLSARAEQAMFPLNNLTHHGMDNDHPYSVSMWVLREGGALTDVLTLTRSGMVMPVLPSGEFEAAARHLRGRLIQGIVGPERGARGVEAALGLKGRAAMDEDEPHYLLHRKDLLIPDGPGEIVPLAEAPEDVIKGWMLDYQLNTLHTPADRAKARAEEGYALYSRQGSHVALMAEGQPLAMTGFNAQVPGMVQVGGVYTPPALRGRGHARRAVALHIAASGAERAVLFTSSPAAERAYRAIGFDRIGTWTLMLLAEAELA